MPRLPVAILKITFQKIRKGWKLITVQKISQSTKKKKKKGGTLSFKKKRKRKKKIKKFEWQQDNQMLSSTDFESHIITQATASLHVFFILLLLKTGLGLGLV